MAVRTTPYGKPGGKKPAAPSEEDKLRERGRLYAASRAVSPATTRAAAAAKATPQPRAAAARTSPPKRVSAMEGAAAAERAGYRTPKTTPTAARAVPESTPKPATTTAARSSSTDKPVSTVKTKGGDFPVYGKKSASGADFRKAFADAKGADFTWQGRKYSGKRK